MRNVQEQTLFDAVTPVAITSSTDATPIVVTATAHGLVTGDRVFIYGHTTNIAANGFFQVVKVTANTFQLLDEFSGANVAGTGSGAGSSGFLCKAPPVMLVSDFEFITLDVHVGTSPTMTLNAVGSAGKKAASATTSPRYDVPNIGATVGPTNPWGFLNLVDLDDPSNFFTGTTGIVIAANLDHLYKVNIAGMKYFTVIPTAWTAGAITIKAQTYSTHP